MALKYTASLLAASLALNAYSFSTEKPEETMVIGTRTPQPIEDTLAPVTLITKKEIQKLQIKSMPELFNTIPGMSITTTGSYGSNVGVFLRGTNAKQTLILINGQRMDSATSGTSAIQYIDPEQVQRIEVIRGARASLYGADAIGGVINIITESDDAPNNVYLSAGAGTYNTQKYSAATTFNATDSTKIQLNVMHVKSDGFDSRANEPYPNGTDNDAFKNSGVNVGLTQKISDLGKVSFSYLRNSGQNDYDTVPTEEPYNKKLLENYSGNLHLNLLSVWDTRLNIAHLRDNSKARDHLGIMKKDNFFTKRTSASWQNDISWSDQQLSTLGIDYYKDSIDQTSYRDPKGNPVSDRNNHAVYIQQQSQYENLKVQAAVRYDDNSDYNSHTTGNISVGIDLQQAMLTFGYATAFRAPTFNELYSTGWNGLYVGNPNLDVEKSRQFEVGLSHYSSKLHWNFNAYLNKMNDLIANEGPKYSPVNVNKAQIQGFDFVVGYQWESVTTNLNYSYIDAVDSETELPLLYRPKNLLNVDIIKSFDRLDMGVSFLARSKSYAYGHVKMAGYATADVFAAYRCAEGLTAKLKFSNLFDKEYVVNNGFNTAGITAFFTLTYDYGL